MADFHTTDNGAKQFNHSVIRKHESYSGDKTYWLFDCSMVSSCGPIFRDCDSNYEVEAVLRKAHVLRKNSNTDTETCALVVMFSTEKAGHAFIDRLNAYLVEQFAKLPPGYVSPKAQDRRDFERLQRQYGW
jgi:hypothetical protein